MVNCWAERRGLSFRKAWLRPFLFLRTQEAGHELILVKPLTFVNRTGLVLPALFKKFDASAQDILAVFDQMDLPPGRVRAKPHGSSAGHNGLRSLDQAMGTDYARLAVGVGRPREADRVIDHVLGRPSADEQQAIDARLKSLVERLDRVWTKGWEALIDAANQRNEPSS